MRRSPIVALAALALTVVTTNSAVAASPSVRAKALHATSVYEAYYTGASFEYQCPTGSTLTVYVSIEQPKTGAFYDSISSTDPAQTYICDGEKHQARIGLVSPGYTEEGAATYEAPYLRDTAQGYGRGTVTVSVTANGRTAVDTTKVSVQSRDV